MRREEFLRFQAVVHAVNTGVEAAVPTERMYAMSLGSQQGNAHLHWHVAPLPPGVPYHRQQFHALMAEHGVHEHRQPGGQECLDQQPVTPFDGGVCDAGASQTACHRGQGLRFVHYLESVDYHAGAVHDVDGMHLRRPVDPGH